MPISNKPWPPIRAARFFRAASIATAFTICVCAGCGSAEPAPGLLEIDPRTDWRDGRLVIDTGIRFEPTRQMREALESGVDLQLEIVTRVSQRFGPIMLLDEKRSHRVTLRFLPLTEQWQMAFGDDELNFPRLWLLLDALEQSRSFEPGLARGRAGDGDWRVRARVKFNRAALPPPMHLPSLLSPQWRLAGTWHTWQIDAS